MPHLSKGTKIEDSSRAIFVPVQVYPVTRETLKKVAKKRRIPMSVLIEELAITAHKRSFPEKG
jgi:hypothetical protein